MSTVLVTGAAGFIGSHLCDRLLAEGKRVVGVDDLSTGRIANLAEARGYGQQFTFYNLDIRLEGMRTIIERYRPEIVMHMAAQASVAISAQNPMLDASVNVLGLLNVLEAAAAYEVRKVVFAASGGTLYGEARSLPVKESAIRGARPVSPYGISKSVAIDYLRFYRDHRGVDFTALALANIYGPRQDPFGEAGVVGIFASKMLVDDVVHAFSLSAGAGSGGLYNVGTGLETSVNRIYQLLAEIVGFRKKPTFGPPREGDLQRNALEWKLAERDLGWKPWTTLEDGLRETAESLRAE
jgi:UDP-glucose 4-epimerase